MSGEYGVQPYYPITIDSDVLGTTSISTGRIVGEEKLGRKMRGQKVTRIVPKRLKDGDKWEGYAPRAIIIAIADTELRVNHSDFFLLPAGVKIELDGVNYVQVKTGDTQLLLLYGG